MQVWGQALGKCRRGKMKMKSKVRLTGRCSILCYIYWYRCRWKETGKHSGIWAFLQVWNQSKKVGFAGQQRSTIIYHMAVCSADADSLPAWIRLPSFEEKVRLWYGHMPLSLKAGLRPLASPIEFNSRDETSVSVDCSWCGRWPRAGLGCCCLVPKDVLQGTLRLLNHAVKVNGFWIRSWSQQAVVHGFIGKSRPWANPWLEEQELQVSFWAGLLNYKWEFIFQLNAFWFHFRCLSVSCINFSLWSSDKCKGV